MGETQTFLPEQVMAMLMTKLKVTAEAGLNTKIVDVVISVSTFLHFLHLHQRSHRLEKYLNLEGFLEKFLKIKSALKSTGKSLKSLEKSLNSTMFCRT